jgi:hypothetical protein
MFLYIGRMAVMSFVRVPKEQWSSFETPVTELHVPACPLVRWCQWENNIKVILRGIVYGLWTGSVWLRVSELHSSEQNSDPSGSIKGM